MSFPPPEPPVPSEPTAQSSREEPRLLTRRDEAAPVATPAPSVASRVRFRPQESTVGTTPATAPRKLRAGTILRTVLALGILSVVILFLAAVWLRHAMHASLPQIDGTLQTTGLSAPVTIARDDHGVPSIQAANLDDLLFAQGFVTAQDRLWQMDALRRHAAGDLAEVLGSKLIEHDRTQRTLQIRASADRALAVLPADQLHQLEAYARGVNAFITQNAGHLPVEFHLLHYTPAPWTPRDSLLVALAMMQDLSTEFPTKLMRETFSAHIAPELLPDLYPVGSWRDHPPGQSVPDLTSARPEIEQIPLDETQSRLRTPSATPQELLEARSKLSLQTCEGCRSGSNDWAVAGSHTASGMPLVSNDMHLAFGVPAIWYEASLHTADNILDVAGLTLPGTPFVIVGRNAHVAWGFTALLGDVQDVYVEHLRGNGAATEFQRADGSWGAVEHHSEHIRVRGGSDVTLDVLTTTHNVGSVQMVTPIISPLYPSEHRALALAWTAYDPANISSPMMGLDIATDGPSLVAACAKFGGPTLNMVYADDHNHIGYQAIGRVPIRGPAVHYPIVAKPADPDEGPAPPPNEEDGASLTSSTPRLLTVGYRPRRHAIERPAPRRSVRPAPEPLEEAPIPVPAAPLGYTIGSPIPPLPADGLDPNAQWSGYIPYNELPAVTNPQSGFVATANARITNSDYPYAVALNWAAPYRVERITHLLANSTGLTPADMLRMEMDVHSELDLALAHRLAYALDHASNGSRKSQRLHQAADILRRWNGDVDVDAPAAAIVAATRAELWPMLLVPQIAKHDHATAAEKTTKPEAVARLYSWQNQGVAMEQLMLHQPARWLPPGVKTWNDLLTSAVDRGLNTANAPGDLSKWSYGKAHPIEINHPLLSNPLLERLLGVTAGSGPHVIAGDTSTIKSISHSFGPSERFTADLSNASATTSNVTTGQSGNPASPWYLDQLPHWLDGTTLPLPLHDAHVSHTLILQP